jgi:hypothetical protein
MLKPFFSSDSKNLVSFYRKPCYMRRIPSRRGRRAGGRRSRVVLASHRAGNAGVSASSAVTNLRAFYHRTQGCGCGQAPGIPLRPSLFWGAHRCTTRTNRVAGTRSCGLPSVCGPSFETHRCGMLLRMRSINAAPKANPHGEERRRRVSNHEAPTCQLKGGLDRCSPHAAFAIFPGGACSIARM